MSGTVCSDCGREWTGMAECHCAGCHRHFVGLTAFDAHFGPDGVHQDPPLVWPEKSKRAGKPAYRVVERKHGLAWGSALEYPSDYVFGAQGTTERAEA